MTNSDRTQPAAVRRARPSLLLAGASLLVCVGIYSALELRSSAETVRWGSMAGLLFILSFTQRPPRDARERPFPGWAYFIPVLLVTLLTAWDVRREAPASAYEQVSSALTLTSSGPSSGLARLAAAQTGPDGVMSKWAYMALLQYMKKKDYPLQATAAASTDAARQRLQVLLSDGSPR